jgi:hypothetical protein
MAQNDNVFTKLSKKEAIIALDTILKYRGDLLLWTKGSDGKEKFRCEDFDEPSLTLFMSPVLSGTQLKDKKILLSFESKNLQYFTTSTLKYIPAKDIYTIEITNDFFKCDKRKNFRADRNDFSNLSLTYKQHSFTGFDLSAGGASLLLPQDSISPFKPKQIIENLGINFNNIKLVAPKAEVRYLLEVTDYLSGNKNTKVGFMFLDVDESFEASIFREINNAIYKKLNPMG